MRLRILSDLHFEFHADGGAGFVRDLPPGDKEIAVLAGDIAVGRGLLRAAELFCKKFNTVVFVPGNHEYYHHSPDEVRATLQACARMYGNFHWLDNAPLEIDGQRFVGGTLWFAEEQGEHPARRYLNDFVAIEDFEPWVYREHLRTVHHLRRDLCATDVVVTHHLPSHRCIHTKFLGSPLNRYFVHDLEWLIRDRQPKLWIHGHTHETVDTLVGDTRIVANPFGYLGHETQSGFNDRLVVEL